MCILHPRYLLTGWSCTNWNCGLGGNLTETPESWRSENLLIRCWLR